MGDDIQVSYSLKEVLSGIDAKLDLALKIGHSKADQAEVSAIAARVGVVEAYIANAKDSKDAQAHKREWLIPVVLSAILAVFEILQYVHI